MNKYEAAVAINQRVEDAKKLLKEAKELAEKAELVFMLRMNGKLVEFVDDLRVTSEEPEHWYSSGC